MSNPTTTPSPTRRRPRRVRSTCLCVVCFFVAVALALAASAALDDPGLVTSPAAAQDAAPFNYEVSTQVSEGEPAKLRFIALSSLDSLQVEIKRKGKKGETMNFSRDNLAGGEEVVFAWEQPAGNHSYQMKVSAKAANGETFGGTATFDVSSVDLLQIGVDLSVDLLEGKLPFETNRPASRAEIAVYGEDKVVIDQGELTFEGKSRRETISWTPTEERPVLVELKVFDQAGAWAAIQVFRLEIPHEDIVFDTNKAEVRDDQEPKLQQPLADIQEALATYDTVAVELYVAGYTDTVGKPDKNRELSEKRAKSIAKWFKSQGLDIPTYYAGFGEEALFAPTGDEVDNEANRRVVYLLTNGRPGVSAAFPHDNWKRYK